MRLFTKLAVVLVIGSLVGSCTGSDANAVSDGWDNWTKQAGMLYRHYDSELGVACYQSTRSGGTYRAQLSCVKVKP